SGPGLQLHDHRLAGPQHAVAIGKRGLKANGAGGAIDLVVDGGQLAFTKQDAADPVVDSDRGRAAYGPPLRQQRLRQREYHLDGLDLSNAEQPLRVAGAYIVAGIDATEADPTAHRRDDTRVGQLDLDRSHGRLAGGSHRFQLRYQRFLSIVFLARDCVLSHQLGVAFEIKSRRFQLGLDPRQLRLRLLERGLNGAVIDARQQIALGHLLTFLEQHLGEYPVDLRVQCHAVDGAHVADGVNQVWDIALLDDGHRHGYRCRLRRHGAHGVLLAPEPNRAAHADEQKSGNQSENAEGRKAFHANEQIQFMRSPQARARPVHTVAGAALER